MLVNRPESADSNFDWDDFGFKVNSELKDNLGNYINRSLKFVSQYFEGKIPAFSLTEDDNTLIKSVNAHIAKYIELLESVKIKDALREIMGISFVANKYVQDNKVGIMRFVVFL